MKFWTLFLLSLCSIGLSAQSLQLKKDKKTKEFDANTYYEVYLGEMDDREYGEDGCCDYIRLETQLSHISQDSLTFAVDFFEEQKGLAGNTTLSSTNYAQPQSLVFAKSEVIQMHVFKSKSAFNRRETWNTIGGILVVTGLATSVNYLVFNKSDNKEDFLISGGIQIVTGSILGLLTKRKKYNLNDHLPKPWEFN